VLADDERDGGGIEVAASTFECPTCHRSDTLNYQIESVTPRTGDLKDGLTFDLKVTSRSCPHEKSFKSVIKAILDVVEVRFGPRWCRGLEI
jgi:hypothetical protein